VSSELGKQSSLVGTKPQHFAVSCGLDADLWKQSSGDEEDDDLAYRRPRPPRPERDGRSLEIDLSAKHAAKSLAPYIAAGRRSKGHTSPRSTGHAAGGSGDVAAIRAWAQEQGYQVSSQGRISGEIRAAYLAGG
jgi:hypothetical protein